jgi:hypothetical protein
MKKHDWRMGSMIGGILTILLVLFGIGIFSVMWSDVFSG